jgi:hypothetical protein
MKIKKGCKYLTRDGHKVRVYATDGNGKSKVHGAIRFSDGWYVFTWTRGGKSFSYEKHDLDIVAEPKPSIRAQVSAVTRKLDKHRSKVWLKNDRSKA